MSPRQRKPRDYAGQNRRANERARALGYRGKDDMYKRRREGNPTPADIKAGGADWARLPGERIWLRVPFNDAKRQQRGEQLIAKLLPTLPPGTDVAIVVQFDDGSYRNLGTEPAETLAGGLALFVAGALTTYGPGAGFGGTGAPKDDTPLTGMKVAALENQLEDEADSSLFDLVTEVQLTFEPAAAPRPGFRPGGIDDF